MGYKLKYLTKKETGERNPGFIQMVGNIINRFIKTSLVCHRKHIGFVMKSSHLIFI